MELIGNAVSVVVTIFVMIALGFIGQKRAWFGPEARKLFSFLVVRLALPGMILYNVTTSYTRADLLGGLVGMTIPLISLLGSWFIGLLLYKVLRISPKRKGVFLCMCTFSNTVFIGVPINTAIFGESALPVMLLYYIVNTLLFWTIGVRAMRADGGDKSPLFSMQTLKGLSSPPLIAFFSSVLLVMLGISIPKPLLEACRYMGGIVTPVSMLFIGTVLGGISLKNLRIDRAQIAVTASRFLLAPLLVFLLSRVITVDILTRDVFIMQAIMPVMTQTSIVADMYGGDVEFATVGTAFTTMLCLLVIPLAAIALPFL